MSNYVTLATTLLALLVLLYCLLLWKKKADTNSKPPPPSPSNSWPLIGHLHLLKGLPHIAFGKLADQYGPIVMIKLGVQKAVVISTVEAAKECFGGTNDRVFLNRPHNIFVEHMAYDSALLGFSPYGQYWREMRKIVTVELRVTTCKSSRIQQLDCLCSPSHISRFFKTSTEKGQ